MTTMKLYGPSIALAAWTLLAAVGVAASLVAGSTLLAASLVLYVSGVRERYFRRTR